MDKYELKVSIDEIDRLIDEHNFRQAAQVADTIDWTRVRSMQTLCRVSDLYKINRRYADSRDLLEIAYEKNPSSRKIIYSLCELELKLDNYIHALQLFNAFINVAPRDPDRYLLQYKLYKKQDVNAREQIAVLEEYLQHDFRERWAYELAALYLKAGEEQRCIAQCDEIVTYFGDGRFVIKALELKKTLTQLTPQQEERLEILLSGGTIAPPAPAQEEASPQGEETPGAGEETPGQAAGNGTKEERAAGQGSGSGTQEERAAGQGSGSGAKEEKASGQAAGSAGEAGGAPGQGSGNAARQAEDKGQQASGSPVRAERSAAGAQEPADAALGDTRPMPALPGTRRHRASSAPEKGSVPAGTAGGEADADEGEEPSVTPEEYTDALLRDANMEETIARGMREIEDYDSVLAQETSGQLAMVMEEEPPEEVQVDGQIDLEQIMSEWEKIRRDSEQQRLADARRRVLERSEEAKRQLYGDDFAGGPAGPGEAAVKGTRPVGTAGTGSGDGGTGSTRSWKREEVENGLL